MDKIKNKLKLKFKSNKCYNHDTKIPVSTMIKIENGETLGRKYRCNSCINKEIPRDKRCTILYG